MTNGTVTFADGQDRATIVIPIINDNAAEPGERFAVSLNGVTGAGLTEPRTAQITIVDNDTPTGPDPLRRQAENMTRQAGWVTGVDGSTTFVHVPNGTGAVRHDDPVIAPKLTDTFNVEAGQYTVRARVRAPSGADDSFWLRVSGGQWFNVGLSDAGGIAFNIQNLTMVGTIAHGGGPLTLEIAQRENGTAIDWIELVPVNVAPTLPGFGIGKAEAEGMALNNLDATGKSVASGGTMVQVGNTGPTGVGRYRFTGPTGTYNLEYAYFDENDGNAIHRLFVNGTQVASFIANEDTGANGADANSYRKKFFTGIQVNNGDEVRFEVTEDAGEFGRVDYLAISTAAPTTGSFSLQNVVTGLSVPTAVDFTSTGAMLIAQQNGIVRVRGAGGALQTSPFIDLRSEVNFTRDRGLLGLAVHPDFANNPYVYLAYTYDPPETVGKTGLAGPDGMGNRCARVIRVTAQTVNGVITAVPGSAVVIAGTNSTWANISRPDLNSTSDVSIPQSGYNAQTGTYTRDFIASDSESHTIGALEFGPDGMLYVSIGDGTSYGFTDPRTARVQDLDSLSGKVLRIDPLTGKGLSDNPFFNGDVDSNRSKVFAYGMRNPFRIAPNPADGSIYVGDVGWTKWEEINKATGGENFGWPWYEGGYDAQVGPYLQRTGGYQDLAAAQQFYNSPANAGVDAPTWAANHSSGSIAIVMGDFISSPLYPAQYQGQLFFSDFGINDVQVAFLDASGAVSRVETVVDGGSRAIVEMTMGPDGYLYVADLSGGTISRLNFA